MHVAYQALILTGGRGTRLGKLAESIPKPLMPIGDGRVFLDVLLAALARSGVTEALLLAGHLGSQVEARYRRSHVRDLAIDVIVEPHAAGTAGALLAASDRLAPEFLLLNGDSLFDIDPQRLFGRLLPEDVGCIALRQVDDASRYGSVDLEHHRIRRFVEKASTEARPGLISAGVYALRRSIVDHIDRSPCSIEVDVFPRLAASDRLAGEAFDGYFIDIGLPETLARARRDFPGRFPVGE
jgi:D-glycero-D-manno-heptose 1,7-bisphosphate phosphatase